MNRITKRSIDSPKIKNFCDFISLEGRFTDGFSELKTNKRRCIKSHPKSPAEKPASDEARKVVKDEDVIEGLPRLFERVLLPPFGGVSFEPSAVDPYFE